MDALLEYEHLKQNYLFSTVKRNAVSGDTVTVLVHTQPANIGPQDVLRTCPKDPILP